MKIWIFFAVLVGLAVVVYFNNVVAVRYDVVRKEPIVTAYYRDWFDNVQMLVCTYPMIQDTNGYTGNGNEWDYSNCTHRRYVTFVGENEYGQLLVRLKKENRP